MVQAHAGRHDGSAGELALHQLAADLPATLDDGDPLLARQVTEELTRLGHLGTLHVRVVGGDHAFLVQMVGVRFHLGQLALKFAVVSTVASRAAELAPLACVGFDAPSNASFAHEFSEFGIHSAHVPLQVGLGSGFVVGNSGTRTRPMNAIVAVRNGSRRPKHIRFRMALRDEGERRRRGHWAGGRHVASICL